MLLTITFHVDLKAFFETAGLTLISPCDIYYTTTIFFTDILQISERNEPRINRRKIRVRGCSAFSGVNEVSEDESKNDLTYEYFVWRILCNHHNWLLHNAFQRLYLRRLCINFQYSNLGLILPSENGSILRYYFDSVTHPNCLFSHFTYISVE